jgi:hypothetical protein
MFDFDPSTPSEEELAFANLLNQGQPPSLDANPADLSSPFDPMPPWMPPQPNPDDPTLPTTTDFEHLLQMHISGEYDDSKSIVDIIEQRILSNTKPFDPETTPPSEFLGNPDALLEMTEEEHAHLQQKIDDCCVVPFQLHFSLIFAQQIINISYFA